MADITRDQATPLLLHLASSGAEKHQTNSRKSQPFPLRSEFGRIDLFSWLIILCSHFLPCSVSSAFLHRALGLTKLTPAGVSPTFPIGFQLSLTYEKPREECGRRLSSLYVQGMSRKTPAIVNITRTI